MSPESQHSSQPPPPKEWTRRRVLLAYLVGLVAIGLAAPTVIAGGLTLLLTAAWGLKPLPEPPLAWSGRGIQRTIYLPWQPGWTYALPVVRGTVNNLPKCSQGQAAWLVKADRLMVANGRTATVHEYQLEPSGEGPSVLSLSVLGLSRGWWIVRQESASGHERLLAVEAETGRQTVLLDSPPPRVWVVDNGVVLGYGPEDWSIVGPASSRIRPLANLGDPERVAAVSADLSTIVRWENQWVVARGGQSRRLPQAIGSWLGYVTLAPDGSAVWYTQAAGVAAPRHVFRYDVASRRTSLVARHGPYIGEVLLVPTPADRLALDLLMKRLLSLGGSVIEPATGPEPTPG